MNTTHSNVSDRIPGRIADTVEDVRSRAIPALHRVGSDADRIARRSVKAVRQSSEHLRGQATRASVTMVRYINDEPVKAVLIAAATGAALMALRNMTLRGGS